MDPGPDQEGEGDGADPDGAAEDEPERQRGDLDHRPDQPQRAAGARVQAGHQAVAGAGAQASPEVDAAADRDRGDAGDDQEPRDRVRRVGGQHLDHDAERNADHDRVEDRPEAGPLAQRDPGREHQDRDQDRRRADAERSLKRYALGEHRPGRVPQLGDDDAGLAGPEQPEAGEQDRKSHRPGAPEVSGKHASKLAGPVANVPDLTPRRSTGPTAARHPGCFRGR